MPRVQYYTPFRVATFVLLLAVGLTVVQVPLRSSEEFPREGQTAEAPVVARDGFSYESDILTEREREAARADVPAQVIFDTGVRTAQVAVLANYLDDVQAIRDDPDLSEVERSEALADLPGQFADAGTQVRILDLSNSGWEVVRGRSIELLTELLSDNIEADELAGVLDGVEEQVGRGVTANERAVIAELVGALLVANVTEDEQATMRARDAAAAGVLPVERTFAKGEVIVAPGEVVDGLAAEALAQMEPEGGGVPGDELVAVLILSVAAAVVLGAYLVVATPDAASSDRRLLLIGVLLVGAVAVARLVAPLGLPEESDKSIELMLPIAASAVLISALLVERTLGVIVATLIAILAGVATMVQPDFAVGEAPAGAEALRPTAVFLFSGIAGVYASYRVERLTQYGMTGAVVGASVFVVGFAFWLFAAERDGEMVLWLLLAAAVAGAGTAVLTIGAFSFLGLAFGITTRLQLLELAQLTQPLLRRLQEEAPGTFHHSLLVATMAERAAAEIEADALLVRVGAYYHDIGKLSKPHMYVENQAEGGNPHDALDPLESARVIQDHVRWGMELGRRHRLPERVRAFIPEHHGTRTVTYFYRKAARQDPNIDPALFTYAGPAPQTRETAIVMMADSCEAVVRSSKERDVETINRLVDGVINERLGERQFDDTDLTFRQLRRIAESFKVTLRGVYHPRIEYPEPTEAERRRGGAPGAQVSAPPAPTSEAPVDGSALPAAAASRADERKSPA